MVNAGNKGEAAAATVLAPWGERYPELDRLVLLLRKKGKKGVAQGVVAGAARRRREAGIGEPYAARQQAIRKLYPVVEVRSVKKAGQNVQRPVARTEGRQLGSALRLLRRVVGGSGVPRDRAGGRTAVDRLAQARLDTLKGKGSAWEKRLLQHRTAVGAIGSLRVQR